MLVGEVVGDPCDQALDRRVLGEHRGGEAPHAELDRAGGEQVAEVSTEALAVEGVADHDGELGRLGVILEPHEPADSGDVGGPVGQHGDERHVLCAVDLGQIAQVGVRQPRLGGEEALLLGLRGEQGPAAREQVLVVRPDRPDLDPGPVPELERHAGTIRLLAKCKCEPRHRPGAAHWWDH